VNDFRKLALKRNLNLKHNANLKIQCKPKKPQSIWDNNNKATMFTINNPDTNIYGAKAQDFNMPTGTVKWFNNAKGYGFVVADDGGEDLFAHYSTINMDGYKTLKAGQPVCFDVIKGDKGLHAINITAPLGASSGSLEALGGQRVNEALVTS
jgi:cold shock protein